MKRLRQAGVGITLSILLASPIRAETANAADDRLMQEYRKLTEGLEIYLDDFSKTIAGVPDSDRQQPQWKALRALKTQLWLKLLANTDKFRDHNFNFSDVPGINVAPPLPYDSGVDPSSIKDPTARHEYEEAIRKNSEKAVRFGFENRLKQLEEDFTREAVQYFLFAYEKTGEDAKELSSFLEASHMSEAQKVDMKRKLQDLISISSESKTR